MTRSASSPRAVNMRIGVCKPSARSFRHISSPLNHLAQAAHRVAAGDLEQTASEKTTIADLRNLARAFNAMTVSLRRADQLKAAFIADVSHELRTPLTALKGTIETLQDGAVDDLTARDRF